jgi:pimeloyl-ACP methyl ester carboxylesterase
VRDVESRGGGLVPGDLFYGVARTDYYEALITALEDVGRFRRAEPGQPVRGKDDRRRYYVLLYDWRKENIHAVRALHDLVEHIRRDYKDPDLPVDVLAHSNGGLIASYYLRYGPQDVLDRNEFTPWDEGAHRIRRMVLLGTPNLGSVISLERLQKGVKIAFRTVPVEVLVTFATPFESLPHPDAKVIHGPDGQRVDLDIYSVDTWRRNRWGIFSPEVEQRVVAAAHGPETGALQLAALHATFVRHLERARKLHLALSEPIHSNGVEVAVFGGDCTLTPGRAVLDEKDGVQRLVVRPEDVRARVDGVDYERLLMQPGDGLVTRDSQLGRGRVEGVGSAYDSFPFAQSFFLCERHDQLSVNPYFQNNLLHFLLSR